MSSKHLTIIAIGLAVLLLLWGGSELLSRRSDTTTGSLALPALAQTGVDTIAVVRDTDSIVLAKQSSGGWTVNGHRAAPAGVTDLFQALQDTARPELVAQDSSSFRRLGVDSAAAHWLRVRGGGKLLLQLVVGGRGSEFQSGYVRRPGDSHVYLWRGRLAPLVDRSADEWRDKTIATLQPDGISALDVQRGKERYTLKRAGKTWALSGGRTDSAAVARYLDRLRAITASAFATPREVDSAKAVRPTRRLTVHGQTGVLLSLAFDSTAAGFLVRHIAGVGGEGPTVYRMTVWDVDGVTPVPHSLNPAKK